jgi:hypothetical protein
VVRRARALLLVLHPVVAVTGCSRDVVGPLDTGGGPASLCVPLPEGSAVAFGDEVLRNDATQPVTIDSVRLVDAQGLALSGSFLVPIAGRTLLGTRPHPPSEPVWEQRKPAEGAVLAPGEERNLVLVLDRASLRGQFRDVEVAYTAGGDVYRHRVDHALLVVPEPPCPQELPEPPSPE